jgi:hypothetical protein
MIFISVRMGVATFAAASLMASCGTAPVPTGPIASPSAAGSIAFASASPSENPDVSVSGVCAEDATNGGGLLCDRELAAVRDALKRSAHRISAIAISREPLCFSETDLRVPCLSPTPAGATMVVGSAIVQFVDTPALAYMNLYVGSTGIFADTPRFLAGS